MRVIYGIHDQCMCTDYFSCLFALSTTGPENMIAKNNYVKGVEYPLKCEALNDGV